MAEQDEQLGALSLVANLPNKLKEQTGRSLGNLGDAAGMPTPMSLITALDVTGAIDPAALIGRS